MNTQIIMDYLTALSMNNNREWYHANKDDYKTANAEFEELLQTLILEIGKYDSSILHNNPKDLTFKIVRDTRFSHDKSPYHPAFRAHISSQGKLPVPVGYYLMLSRRISLFWEEDCLLICLKKRRRWFVILLLKMAKNGNRSYGNQSLRSILRYRERR